MCNHSVGSALFLEMVYFVVTGYGHFQATGTLLHYLTKGAITVTNACIFIAWKMEHVLDIDMRVLDMDDMTLQREPAVMTPPSFN